MASYGLNKSSWRLVSIKICIFLVCFVASSSTAANLRVASAISQSESVSKSDSASSSEENGGSQQPDITSLEETMEVDKRQVDTDVISSTKNFTIPKCLQKDSAGLNECLDTLLKELKPRLAEGVPEMNIPSIEPLTLNNVTFDQGYGAVRVSARFMSVEVYGLSNFTQSHFWVDVPKKTLDFDLMFPELYITGTYELDGNIFFIPIGGSGDFYFNLENARAKGTSRLASYKNETTSKVIVKKTEVNLDIETIKVHLTNLFNGDHFMGTFLNKFLNDNSQEVFQEIKPQIGAEVGEILSLMANRALESLPTSEFDEIPFSPDPIDEQ